MDEHTLSDFESWAEPFGYDLQKTPSMRTENPYSASGTWKAYEAWCAAKEKYGDA